VFSPSVSAALAGEQAVYSTITTPTVDNGGSDGAGVVLLAIGTMLLSITRPQCTEVEAMMMTSL
jgi:hypothetical protein